MISNGPLPVLVLRAVCAGWSQELPPRCSKTLAGSNVGANANFAPRFRLSASATQQERSASCPKAIRFNQLGGPEVLHFEDLPERQPGLKKSAQGWKSVGLNRRESMYFHGFYMER